MWLIITSIPTSRRRSRTKMLSSFVRLIVVCLAAGLCSVATATTTERQHCGEALTAVMTIVCKTQTIQGYSKRSGRSMHTHLTN